MQRADDERAARRDRLELVERLERHAPFGDDPFEMEELDERAAEIIPHRQRDAAPFGWAGLWQRQREIVERPPLPRQPRRDQSPGEA